MLYHLQYIACKKQTIVAVQLDKTYKTKVTKTVLSVGKDYNSIVRVCCDTGTCNSHFTLFPFIQVSVPIFEI